MRKQGRAAAVLLLAVSGLPAAAQDTVWEWWPKVEVYINQGERARIVFVESLNADRDAPNTQGNFAYYFDYALRPLFRRELRRREDVFRRRFLTFRAGYQYTTSLGEGDYSEHRAIVENTARYPLPAKVVVLNRLRGEFRFIKGQGYSNRFRDRLGVERDLRAGRFAFTPYIEDEIFYDTRYDAWSRNRLSLGVQIPAGPHVVFDPHLVREVNWRSTPRNVRALALTLNLYF